MKKRISIKNRVAINAVIFKGILTASIAIIGYRLYVMSVEENTVSYADTVLKYAYSEAEEYAFGDMIKNRVIFDNFRKLTCFIEQSQMKCRYRHYIRNRLTAGTSEFNSTSVCQILKFEGAEISYIFGLRLKLHRTYFIIFKIFSRKL